MDNDSVMVVFNLNSHFLKAGDGGKAVGPLEKVADFRGSFCNRTKHHAAVRDGLVTWYGYFAL